MASHRVSVFYKALNETMVEYFQKTSLNGFGLLYFIRRRKYQRFFWFLFIVLGCSFATYVVMYTLLSFLDNPTVTILASQNYPIHNIPFPAIAICSANKLSGESMTRFAKDLSLESNKTADFWFEKLQIFAAYFDYNAVDFKEALQLEIELNSTFFTKKSITKTLKSLAPSCENLLLLCSWAGIATQCQELFQLHATISGHCCLFNYQADDNGNKTRTIFYPNGTTIDKGGLMLLLNASSLDYSYSNRNIKGFVLQIFDPYNFPDPSTGGVHEVLISANQNVNIELGVITQTAAEEARKYDVLKRFCYFDDENLIEYGDAYSQAECFSRCRMKSILKLCNCLPYYTPKEYFNRSSQEEIAYCSLAHLECLSQHEITWYTFYQPEILDSASASISGVEGLVCPNCLPLCSYNQYICNKNSLRLNFDEDLKDVLNSTNNHPLNHAKDLSLVNLHFTKPYATQYHKNVLYNWYQILSNIGGVIGISIGCSLISGFEVIYFITYRLIENIMKYNKVSAAK